ncbi:MULTISPECIES: coniferyl aldehyde dehydrogenase [Microbulbifer]|uniref:coniferyl aldehyde dehydrogenase n=1 Tax=Microbulbifer TaxID=48073 RepID=UPI001E386D67|nr:MULTISPECIES: coniferyl aldehyde dehydrogenase [Microbulbifer]UHQ54125.1 coniferyl aldehyde dehydrogenase [Microbulbifer sp. YPW16]
MNTDTLTLPEVDETRQREMLQALLEQQRNAYLQEPAPDYDSRVSDLKTLARMLRDHQDAIVQAISDDYGNRSGVESLFCEVYVALDGIKDAIKNLKKWMKPQRRHTPMLNYPLSKNRVIPQPLGVVGVIVPWNFPVNLAFAPLTSIFAAGNRAMVKMSYNSCKLAALLERISGDYFPPEKLTFIADDDGSLGPIFSTLKFDHLLFTGSTATGRAVMRSAADNLTPVTLELGGKSPAIIGPDFSLNTAAERIMFWKLLNAGQICTTVDYLFVPENSRDSFVNKARLLVQKRYPDLQSEDYTSVIDDNAYRRLWATLDDAVQKGATAIDLSNGQGRRDDPLRKFPPHLLLDVTDDMEVMQREIFGPLLPIKTYRDREEVARYINARPRPLALYPFTDDRSLTDYYVERVISGGVTVNNCILHVAQHDIPFGGVGDSGMGHYHGYEGFIAFSKLRPVFYQGPLDPLKMLMPPYGKTARKILDVMIKMTR